MTPGLVYKPLPNDVPTIRLLLIAAPTGGAYDDGIVCTTVAVPLNDPTALRQMPYRALSYSWRDKACLTDLTGPESDNFGALVPPATIVCDGLKTQIPQTLNLALWRLRQRFTTPRVWVDYLCINQADDDEKTSQVSLMSDIYALADEVVVWLGESTPGLNTLQFEWHGDDRDYDFIGHYIRCFSKWEASAPVSSVSLFSPRSIDRPEINEDARENPYPPEVLTGPFVLEDRLARPSPTSGVLGIFCLFRLLFRSDSWPIRFHGGDLSILSTGQRSWSKMIDDMIWALSERPWWKRTWVVQECVLAKRAVVYCGGMSAPWDMFAGGAQAYLRKMAQQDLLRSSETNPLLVLSKMILQIEAPRKLVTTGSGMRLVHVLRQFHSRQATDSRDKVFGLLGLVGRGASYTITPNYQLTAPEVFIQAAVQILQEDQGLALLLGPRTLYKHPSIPNSPGTRLLPFLASQLRRSIDIPSWCVNWEDMPTESERLRLQCLDLYAADGSQPSTPVYLHAKPRGFILQLNVYPIGEIDAVEDALLPERGYGRLRSAAANIISRVLRTRPELQELDICRHICADVVHDSLSRSLDDRESYRRCCENDSTAINFFMRDETTKINRKTAFGPGIMRQSYIPPPETTAGRNSVYYAMEAMAGGRRVFYSRIAGGNVGIGPPDIKPGDLICIVPGLSVPLVLRRTDARFCVGNPVSKLCGEGPTPEPGICNTRHERCYVLVGDVYVPGVMDGQLMAMSPKLFTAFLV
ncbi:heterokaryon incompatibility protein-domain-containing protein [Echria macrotheca]|uniref:Heterokaryon incompatibility protein-domain-containing protein n=1 Tax=Echria macrotheca TaxID=438768 RepID=A0AAJ0B529_9PEZI|nr:heterokaryon incompatibility protein-domain-containing protein [Echria macrotheca]